MSASNSARPFDPDSIRLYYSKPRAALVLGLNLVASLWMGYLLVAGLLAGHVVILIAGGVTLLFAGPVVALHAKEALRALTQEFVVVTLDADGVTDVRKKDSFVAWEDIGQVSLGTRRQTRGYLIVDFRDGAVAKARGQGPLTFFVRLAASIGDWHVNLRPLKCNTADVLRSAKRLHQLSIRRQVVERNGPSSRGWSGTL